MRLSRSQWSCHWFFCLTAPLHSAACCRLRRAAIPERKRSQRPTTRDWSKFDGLRRIMDAALFITSPPCPPAETAGESVAPFPNSSASTAASGRVRRAARKAIRCMAARLERVRFRKRIIAFPFADERANLKASHGKSRAVGPGNKVATGATLGPAQDMSRPARSIDAKSTSIRVAPSGGAPRITHRELIRTLRRAFRDRAPRFVCARNHRRDKQQSAHNKVSLPIALPHSASVGKFHGAGRASVTLSSPPHGRGVKS